MPIDEKDLVKDFPMRGIASSAKNDEFGIVRGTMCEPDEFGGWGKNLSKKPYRLDDGRGAMESKSEVLSYAEATAVKENHLCLHGYVNTTCPHRRSGETVCRVKAG